VALGRGVLGVRADIQVQAGAVGEEHVAAAPPRHDPAEEVARDLVGAQAPLAPQGAGDAVLVLEPEDATIHARTLPAERAGAGIIAEGGAHTARTGRRRRGRTGAGGAWSGCAARTSASAS